MPCAADQRIAEIIISKTAYLRQCESVAGSPVAVSPSRNFISRNLTIIIAAATHQKIISEVRVDLLLPMKILAAHIIRVKLPRNIQKVLINRADIPLCLSIVWLAGADIMYLLKKSLALIYLGGGPTTPFLPAGFCVIPHPFYSIF
jgi:hypothetical protein